MLKIHRKLIRKPTGLLPTMAMLLFSGASLGLISLYFATGSHGLPLFRFYLTQPTVLVLNLLPFVLLNLLLFALFNRAWAAFALNGAVCLFFSWAQYWKLMGRNDPIYAEDLTIISEAAQMAGQYVQFTWQIGLSAAIFLAGIGVLLLFRGRIRKRSFRLGLAAALVALCAWLYPNFYADEATYNAMTVWPQVNQWFDTNRYISRGGIYPFLHSIPDAIPTPPEGYDAAETETALSAYPSDDIPEAEKVSIIVTQLEAFTDFSEHTDRITGADPYAVYHEVLAESYHGTLLPNVFSGGTIDTERCVLTGFSVLESFRRPSWSYARYFADQGYTITGSHAGYEAFYNRLNVNANLGIPDFRFIEEYYENYVQGIPMDEYYLTDVAEHTLAAMAEGPVFSFNVTYQNHGPYSAEVQQFQEVYVPKDGLSDSDWHIVNNYLAGVEDTANRMAAMLDTFRNVEEPVILVFYGDHKPWLGEQSVTYGALGIDISFQDDESFYNYYATDYLIWANDAAKAALGCDFVGQGPDISPCFLMNVLFEQCGWEGPGFQKLTDEVLAQVPMLHTTGRYLVDGAITTDLSEPRQALVDQMTNAQYYLAQDAGGVHP